MAKPSPTALRTLIFLILITGGFSCGNQNGTTSDAEMGLHLDYQCVGNFGPCDDRCDQACCYRICRSSYSGLNPCPVCTGHGTLKFCLCYHDCY
ncbi:hypothetical protein DM860_011791 [Cuscuta australis]|uniref:Defensin-like protein n=1 Tax=Cuscuta australis TaxID=267555 RepID=A0A328DG62_9ASTE|nr:hypothetical protein DM860_011791 [Cuscuta australis]